LAPALHAARTDVASALGSSSDRIEGAGLRLPLRSVLLGTQVAISVVLLVCAGLLVRSVSHGYSGDLGFTVDGVRTATFHLPASLEPARRDAFAIALAADTRETLHGVGWTTLLPFGQLVSGVNTGSFRPPDQDPDVLKRLLTPAVSNGFFDVLGIPLVEGRLFRPGDADAAILNESMARKYWPGRSAIGQILTADRDRRIVGVVKDVVFTTGFAPDPTMYRPLETGAWPQMVFTISGEARAQSIAAAAKQIEPRVRVKTAAFEEALDRRFAGSRMAALIASILGALSVALAAVGVFGVFRYTVQQRTREIGIRMALGARPGQVVLFVVQSGATALTAGLALGLAAALGASALLRVHCMA
jgi:putative ABC transport system permease protein